MGVIITPITNDHAMTHTQSKPTTCPPPSVVLKDGKPGLRFGPVVTGHVALGKDGCGY